MKNLLLYGLPFSGKSTVGKLLAKVLEKEFLDTDRELEKMHRMTCRQLFRSRGEKIFRELERNILNDLGSKKVIALGGGTLTDSENVRIAKRSGALIYLACDKAKLKKRIDAQKDRPAYLDGSSFDKLEKKRKLLYESIADYVVDTTGKSPRHIAHHIGEIFG